MAQVIADNNSINGITSRKAVLLRPLKNRTHLLSGGQLKQVCFRQVGLKMVPNTSI